MGDRTIAIIGVGSALVSACMAFLSWWYNRELSKATVSLVGTGVKVGRKRVGRDSVDIHFLFRLKNVGKETLRITELCLGHFDFKRKTFEQVPKTSIPNPMHREAEFDYQFAWEADIDPQIPDEKIADTLPIIVGKHALILSLKYKGTSLFPRRETSVKYFAVYEGYKIHQLTSEDEYREMEGHLPQEFRADK